jgi:hypothetical protein
VSLGGIFVLPTRAELKRAVDEAFDALDEE